MCHTFDGTGLILLCSCLRFRVWLHEVNVFCVSIRAIENYEFDKIRTAGVTGNATNHKSSQGDNSVCSTRQSRRQRGASGTRPPHLKSVPPFSRLAPRLLHISNTVFKKCGPHLFFCPSIWFLAPLLLNLGDRPAIKDEISQPSRPISPRAATGHNVA